MVQKRVCDRFLGGGINPHLSGDVCVRCGIDRANHSYQQYNPFDEILKNPFDYSLNPFDDNLNPFDKKNSKPSLFPNRKEILYANRDAQTPNGTFLPPPPTLNLTGTLCESLVHPKKVDLEKFPEKIYLVIKKCSETALHFHDLRNCCSLETDPNSLSTSKIIATVSLHYSEIRVYDEECPVCLNNYNDSDCIPLLYLDCQHKICSVDASTLKKCPSCMSSLITTIPLKPHMLSIKSTKKIFVNYSFDQMDSSFVCDDLTKVLSKVNLSRFFGQKDLLRVREFTCSNIFVRDHILCCKCLEKDVGCLFDKHESSILLDHVEHFCPITII